MPININNKNYSDYKKVFEIIVRNEMKSIELSSEFHPINVLNNWEKSNFRIAKLGLKEGLRDCISSLKEYSKEIHDSIQKELAEHNLPNIQTLIGLTKDTLKKVIKNKMIKNLDEFYIVKEFVIDLTSNISNEDRILLYKYMFEFEFNQKSNR